MPKPKGPRPMPKRLTPIVRARLDELRLELASTPLSNAGLARRFAAQWAIGERQVRMYIGWIRDEMRADAASVDIGDLRREMILQVKALYGACMARGSYAAAGRAQDRLIMLLGLDAPRRIELSGRDGAAIPVRREYKVDGLDEAKVDLLLEVLGEVEASSSDASNEGEKQEVPECH